MSTTTGAESEVEATLRQHGSIVFASTEQAVTTGGPDTPVPCASSKCTGDEPAPVCAVTERHMHAVDASASELEGTAASFPLAASLEACSDKRIGPAMTLNECAAESTVEALPSPHGPRPPEHARHRDAGAWHCLMFVS